jgi:hypothetical protein
LAWVIVTVQVPLPVHALDQPEKVEPPAGVAVRVTFVAATKECEHVEPQLIPAGLEVTVPEPEPDFVTCNSCGCGLGIPTVTWSDLVPVRPALIEESLSVTVRVTVFVPVEE